MCTIVKYRQCASLPTTRNNPFHNSTTECEKTKGQFASVPKTGNNPSKLQTKSWKTEGAAMAATPARLTLVVVGVVLCAQLLDRLVGVLLHGRDALELGLHAARGAIRLRGRLKPLPPRALLLPTPEASRAKAPTRSESRGRGNSTCAGDEPDLVCIGKEHANKEMTIIWRHYRKPVPF